MWWESIEGVGEGMVLGGLGKESGYESVVGGKWIEV